MNDKGRKQDVLFEDFTYTDPRTGVQMTGDSFYMWADAGLKDLIEGVEGVQNAYAEKSKYHIYIDPRYDREFLKREIEAAILCRGES